MTSRAAWLSLLALATVVACDVATAKQYPKEGTPTHDATVSWIGDKFREYPSVTECNGGSCVETSRQVRDTTDCVIAYTIVGVRPDRSIIDERVAIPLRDLSLPVRVGPARADTSLRAVRFETVGGRRTISVTAPDSTRTMHAERELAWAVPSIADRMGRALTHAARLCGAVDTATVVEPF